MLCDEILGDQIGDNLQKLAFLLGPLKRRGLWSEVETTLSQG